MTKASADGKKLQKLASNWPAQSRLKRGYAIF
jgi:hypothetical protein